MRFSSGKRGTTLTPAGEYFLGEAREMLSRLSTVKQTLANFAKSEDREIVLGLPSSLSMLFAVPLLQRMHALPSHPKVRLVEEYSHMLAPRILSGDVDIALAFNAPKHRDIVSHALVDEPMFFVTGPQNKFSNPGTISFREMAEATFVFPTEKGQIIQLVREEMTKSGLRLNVAYQVESLDAIKDLIRQNAACAILPYGIVSREASAGTLFARRIMDPPLYRRLHLLKKRSSDREHGGVIRTLTTFVQALPQTTVFETLE